MNSPSPSNKSFPFSAHTTPTRNVPTVTKATSIDVHPKSAKTRLHTKKTLSKQEQQQQQQPSDELSSPQKKRQNRHTRKSFSTGSLGDVKVSKTLSQESVTILKRGNAGDLSTFLDDPFTVSREESAHSNSVVHIAYSGKQEQTRSCDPSPSRRRNIQPPSKSRRAQRRKDVEAITDALQNPETDTLFETSPLQTNSSTSSGESSDDVPIISGNEKVVTLPKAEPKRKPRRQRVVSFPPTTNNPKTFPPLTVTTVVEEEIVEEVKKVTFAKSVRQARRGSFPAVEIKHHITSLTPTSSAPLPATSLNDSHVKATSRVTPGSTSPNLFQSKASPLYAGPTFSNSPAPNALPLPSFNSRALGESLLSDALRSNAPPTTPTAQRLRTTSATSFLAHHSAGFKMDESLRIDGVGELHAPTYQQDHVLPRDFLSLFPTSVATQSKPHPILFTAPQPPMFQSYHLPPKMMTSHPPQNGIAHEMTMSLRNMLKIE